jgi:hypothetical protein
MGDSLSGGYDSRYGDADQKRKAGPVSQRGVGAEVGGLAIDPPPDDSSISRLVQANGRF